MKHNHYQPREVAKPPTALVQNGEFQFGTFDSGIRNINPLEAANPLGKPDLEIWKYLRLKEWQAFQFGNEDYFGLTVIYNSKFLGLVQFVLVDKKNNKKWLYEKMVPFWECHVAQGLYQTTSSYKDKTMSLTFRNDLDKNKIHLSVSIKKNSGGPDIEFQAQGFHDPAFTSPIVICQPFGPNRALYSHKNLMPMSATLTQGEKRILFSKEDSFLIMDDHKGYYPYEMKYDWVTGAGRNKSGNLIGFNLTDNQILDHEKYNENCLWVKGKMVPLPPIKVSRPDGVHQPWTVRDDYGLVDIRFTPLYPGEVKINVGVMASDYYGPYGSISGSIKDLKGKSHSMDGLFGMGEQKYVRA